MADLLVGPDGYATIQAAIDAASSGDTILVAAGTYDGAFTVTKSLTIRAADPDAKPEIVGTGTRATIAADNVTLEDLVFDLGDDTTTDGILLIDRGGSWPAYSVEYSDITLSGLEFHGGRRAIYATAEDLTIEDSVFEGQYRDAVFINAAAGDTTISGNAFSGTTGSKAIVFENFSSADPAVSGTITISDNTLTGKGNFVVYNQWQYAPGSAIAELALTITDNVISDTSGAPISIFDPRPYDSGFDLARFDKFSLLDVSDNTITLSAGEALELPAGIEFTGVVDFDGNEVSGTGDADAPIGTPGDDTILGLAGDDAIAGGDGDDTITGGTGADTIDGGTGIDAAVYAGTLSAGSITAAADTDPDTDGDQAGWHVAGGAEGSDTLVNVEIVEDAGQGRILLVGNGGFATIQAAIDAANRGDTILVAAGTYAESITITKGVTLIGLGDVTIDPASGAAITISGDLGGADVTLDNLTIAGGTNGVYVAQTANAGTLIITGCTISGNSQHGLYVLGDDPDNDGNAPIVAGITALEVVDTAFSNNGFQNNYQGSSHIKLFGFSGDALFQNVVIEGAADNTAVASRPDNAIEIVGYANNGNANVPPNAGAPDIGTVVFDGVTVSGEFHKNPVAIYNFSGLDGLSIPAIHGGLDLSGAESSWGPLFNIDGIEDSPIDASDYAVTFPDDGAIKTEIQGDKPGQDETNQTITGTADSDALMGKGGTDVLNGGDGDDTLYGGDKPGGDLEDDTGSDTLHGGAGDDTLLGQLGDDTVDGGDGGDTILYALGDGADTVDGGADSDTFVATGTAGDDTIDIVVASGAVASVEGTTLANVETIAVDGGAGTDAVVVSGVALTPAALSAVADADPVTEGNQPGWSLDTGNGSVLLEGVETVSDGASNILLVGSGGYATIQAAIDAAAEGDTIVIAAGTYRESIVIDKDGLTLVGAGDVIIDGTLHEDNSGYTTETLAAWLKTTAGYLGGGIGVTINADGVTLQNLTISDSLWGIELGAGIDGTTLSDLTIQSNVYGIYKQGTSAVTNLTIDGGLIADGLNGIDFEMALGGGRVEGVTIDGTQFEHLLRKGIYAETLSDAHLTNIAMEDVGQFGGTTFNGSLGAGGNGININLKYGAYSDIEIDGFTFNNVGASDRDGVDASSHPNGGAIVIEARDDGGYAGNPATLTGVTIHDGTISGHSSTGIHVGEPAKDNAGPAVTVTNVTISAEVEYSADHGDIANESQSAMTITGTGDGDSLVASGDSDGPFVIDGAGGNDTIGGGSGNDTLTGGAGDDAIDGGTGTDTAVYAGVLSLGSIKAVADTDPDSDGDQPGWQVSGGEAEGTDTLTHVELIDDDAGGHILLVGNGGYVTIQAAVDAATTGDTIVIAAGTYSGNVIVNKQLTIVGAQWGVDGRDDDRDVAGGSGESTISGLLNILAAGVVVDGVRILNGANGSGTGSDVPGIFVQAADVTIRNSVFYRAGTVDSDLSRAIMTKAGSADGLLVTDNLMTGWHTGIYINGGQASEGITVSDNAFTGNLVGLSMDAFAGGLAPSITGNTFTGNLLEGIGIGSIGGAHWDITGVTGNTFTGPGIFNYDPGLSLAGLSRNTLAGTDGDDSIAYTIGTGAYAVDGGDGEDTLEISGTTGADSVGIVLDETGHISAVGGLTVESVENAVLDADAGIDTLDYTGTTVEMAVDLSIAAATGLESIAGIENVTGGAGDDTLTGDSGANTLAGGDGSDTLSGGLGVDDIKGGAGDDTIEYTIGDGTDTIDGGTDQTGDTLAVTGTSGDDMVDVILTGGVISTIEGMTPAGVESFTLDGLGQSTGGDTLSYAGTAGDVAVDLGAGSATGFASIAGMENVTGGSGSDTLTGNSGSNTLNGGGGNDTLGGGLGADAVNGGAGDDTITYVIGDGADAIDGGADADTLAVTGTTGDDAIDVILTAGAISGFEGGTVSGVETVTLDALGGNDTLSYAGTAGGVAVSLAGGTATGFASIAGVENVTGGDGNDTLTGDGGANVLTGGGGDDTVHYTLGGGIDTIDGGADGVNGDTLAVTGTSGDDTVDVILTGGGVTTIEGMTPAGIETFTLDGLGQGNGGDTLSYAGTVGSVAVDLDAGTATGFAAVADVENVTGGDGDDTLSGDEGANALIGGAGGDTLAGALGSDTISGGAGNDTIRYTIGDGADTIDGGADADTLAVKGTTNDDTIDIILTAGVVTGLEGGSVTAVETVTLDARGGGDTLSYAGTAGAVVVDLAGGAATGFAYITGVENVTGGSGNDTLTGDAGANVLAGGGGDDSLEGGGGNDTALYAGALALTDIASNDSGGWTVTAGAEGTDSLANIKYVQHADGRYLLVGNGGFATLADAIAQATKAGDTVVFVTAPVAGEDVAVDVPDPGTDVNVSLPYDANFTITIQGNHDNTVATGGGDDVIVTGDGADVIEAGAGNDYVNAGAGDDEIHGGEGAGNDIYEGGSGDNTVVYPSTSLGVLIDLRAIDRSAQETLDGTTTIGALLTASALSPTLAVGYAEGVEIGTDVLINVVNASGGDGDDTIYGNDTDNVLEGGAGDDTIDGVAGLGNTITGGAGTDTVHGGIGDDTIVYVAGDGTDALLDGGEDYSETDLLTIAGTDSDDTIKLVLSGGSIVKLSSNDDDHGQSNNVVEIEFVWLDLSQGGSDTLDYAGTGSGDDLTVDLVAKTATGFDGEIKGVTNVTGGDGDDALTGNDDGNELDGGDGADTLSGGAGSDVLTGGLGIDSVSGGDGNDIINYTIGDGVDTTVDGGADTDTLAVSGTAGDDTIDVVVTGGAITAIEGMTPSNVESVTVDGLGQSTLGDTLSYAGTGGGGAQEITVNLKTGSATGFASIAGIENVTGGGNADTLTGDDGANVLDGSGGADTLTGGKGNDTVYGGDGDDTINYTIDDGSDTIDGGGNEDGDDILDVTGTAGDDTIDVVLTSGVISGFEGGTVANVERVELDALAGSDTLSYAGTTGAVTVNLATPSASGFYSIAGVENVTGGDGDDKLTGDDGANTLTGGAGKDRLVGGLGNDTIQGGASEDTIGYTLGDGVDTIDGGTGTDTLAVTGTAGDDTIDVVLTGSTITTIEGMTPSNIETFTLDALGHSTGGDTLSYAGTTGAVDVNLATPSATGFTTIAGIENVTGGSGDDKLTGGDGANVLSGGAGGDRLDGGKGNDTIEGGAGDDTIGYTLGDGTDAIDGGANSDTLMISGTAAEETIDVVIAGGVISTVAGITPANIENFRLDALGGSDTISYAAMTSDVLVVLGSSATGFISIRGVENATGGAGNDALTGDDEANTLVGGAGADTLSGGKGDDNIQGGAGNDTVRYTLGQGTDTIDGGADSDTLVITGTGNADTIDVILTAGVITTIEGMTPIGIEGFTVGALGGSDTLSYAGTTGAVVVDLGAGSAAGFSSITRVENVTGGSGDDTLTGDGNANTLTGGAGADTLRGGLGDDSIQGGAGNDTIAYAIGDGGDTIDGGADSDTLAVTGTAGADTIDVILSGGVITSIEGLMPASIEVFTLDALGDTDTLSYAGTSGGVTVDLASATATGFGTLAGVENVTGGSGGDTLTGNGGTNVLAGGDGNDALAGGAGDDTLAGSGGTDTAAYAGALAADSIAFVDGAWVIESGAEGTDTLSGIERLVHGGTGAILLVGGDGYADRAAAEAVMAAGDVLVFASTPAAITDGDSHADRAVEGAANGDTVGIDANAATDSVGGAITFSLADDAGGRFAINAASGVVTVADAALLASVDAVSLTITVRATNALGAYSEQTFAIEIDGVAGVVIEGTKDDDVLVGDSGDDTLIGGKGKDRLDGKDGDDLLIGGGSKDVIDGGPGNDTVSYATSRKGVKIDLGKTKQKGGQAAEDKLKGIENAIGSDRNDKLIGNGGDNLLDGRKGKDTLIGKEGADTLIGGKGKDTFAFKAGYGTDTIADFKVGDTIDIDVKGFGTFKALKAAMAESDGDVVIDFGHGDSLTIADTAVSSLHRGDFDL